jgi:hypothetical protein
MSSVRDYLTPEPLMFVTDLTKGPRGGDGRARGNHHVAQAAQAAAPHAPSIYERVRERKRQLEAERDNCGALREKLEAMREERDGCTQRYKLKRRRELDGLIAEAEEELRSTENGDKVKEFVENSAPYLKAFQRQQFCRPQNPVAGAAEAQGDAPVLSLVGGVARHVPPAGAASTGAQQLSRGMPSVVDDYAVAMEGAAPTYDIEAKDTCKACGEPVQLHTGLSMLVCVKCGAAQPFLDATAALLSFSDDSYDYTSFSYKRINHFCEWIAAMQAKETTEIPQSVLDSVMERLVVDRVEKTEDITVHKVREVLKKLKLRKYYEHTQLITCKITGRPPPRMTPTQEERIKLLFMAASTAFQQLCPPDRSNFLSYSFTLFKFSELLGYTEFLPNFALLRGQAKLRRQDEIYKALCEALDWEFIPSIGT